MSSYNILSKRFYINIFTEYLAYEMYHDTKYHKKYNNAINQILNTCFDPWPISDEEKEVMITNAKVIFKDKYELKSQN
jgi:hypothetical protein